MRKENLLVTGFQCLEKHMVHIIIVCSGKLHGVQIRKISSEEVSFLQSSQKYMVDIGGGK